MKKKSIGVRPRAILSVDVGGSHVKMMTDKKRTKLGFESGPGLSAKAMVKKVAELTADWTYDVVSVGYPGPVVHDRPTTQPYNLGTGWKGFDFARAFGRPTKVVNDALMQALGSYEGGKMLFLGLGTGLGSSMIVDGVLVPMELDICSIGKRRRSRTSSGRPASSVMEERSGPRTFTTSSSVWSQRSNPTTWSSEAATPTSSARFPRNRVSARTAMRSLEAFGFG